MAVIYKRMIENDKMTLADVPARWRAAVQALMDAAAAEEEQQ